MMQVNQNSNETLGVLVMKTRGFFPQAYWYWIGVGALIGYVFLFNFLFTLALQYLSREYRLSYLFSSFSTLLEPIFRTFFFLLLYLQHSERIKQGYLRRNCWREMLQQLKSLLSYRIEREFQVCS
jgi:hypothetical protein